MNSPRQTHRLLAATTIFILFGSALLHSQAALTANARIGQILSQLERVRDIRQTALSPDDRQIAWVVEEKGLREIEVAPIGRFGSVKRVIAGHGSTTCDEGDIAWSPDSKLLAFTSGCESSSQAASGQVNLAPSVYVADPASGSAPRRLTQLQGFVKGLDWSPDGKQVGFFYVKGATRASGALAAMKPPSGVIGVEDLEVQRIASIDAASGKLRMLTPANLYVYEFDWSPDSRQLVYTAAPPPGEDHWWTAQLYTQLVTGNHQPRSIFDPSHATGPMHGLQMTAPRWSPDGNQIAFIGGIMSDFGVRGGDIYILPATGGSPRNLTAGRPSSVAWIDWSNPGSIRFSEFVGGDSRFSGIDPSTGVENAATHYQVSASVGSSRLEGVTLLEMNPSFAKNGHVAFIEDSFSKPPEVYTGAFDDLHQVTHLNDACKPSWGKAVSISWMNGRFHVQGWLLLPANYDPARKYPLIVYIHGGPANATRSEWPDADFGPAPFSALGYFVLLPNYRGSFGEGEQFTLANRKDFGYGDFSDILTGVDAVEKKYPVDDHRVGLTGWSNGGYLTMFGVTQTNRFRAAVAGAGLSDWLSYYGENSIDGWMLPYFGASVYDDPGVYARSSPITFIKNVKTPTLVVVGDRDGECPAPQSFEFWHALRAEHVPTELVVYPNEGHGFVLPEHKRDVLARALAWFEHYMPPATSTVASR